jgi:hypothetical protein
MKINEALTNITKISYPDSSPPVVQKSIDLLSTSIVSSKTVIEPVKKAVPGEKAFVVAVASAPQLKELGIKKPLKPKDFFIYILLRKNGTGYCVSSHNRYLYSFINHLIQRMGEWNIDVINCGKWIVPSFIWQRISYDYFLTQQGRIQQGLNRESYLAELARLGFTHIEVNGLAFPMGLETGPGGEAYPMFYTYCPALDQFVSSRLNKGLYPNDYLSANLAFLKQNAKRAVEYGLVPGLLCFEPRSVPEQFFHEYPMLRGARVDHPFRSFKPRYNMTITHPLVRQHYAELIRNLMLEVPGLGFITIWTNDSGAGFEHTKSLYVGRNGGAYLIREWKDDAEISRLAGENALRFFRLLRDEARRINPDFRVITRMESFYGEHETIWEGLTDGLEIETSSLLARGWEMPYTHPIYRDSNQINAGTVYQMDFDEREKKLSDDLMKRKSVAHFYFSAGPHSLFDPLIGIPYPSLTHQRLKMMYENGVRFLACTGGIPPPELVPHDINQEVIHTFQYEPDMDIDAFIENMALKWTGGGNADVLLKAWKLTEKAILAFPIVTPLYSTYGFTWYRLWARPLVPDIEKIPQEQRDYYENFMCTTPHNPNNVDLSRDVLFHLTDPEKSDRDMERIDANVWGPLNSAITELEQALNKAPSDPGESTVLYEQWIRIKALKCWMTTQRNIAAWITGVYGYMNAGNEKSKSAARKRVVDLIQQEIDNSNALCELLDSGVEFMAMTDQGETPLVYGKNLKELLKVRISLMEKHIHDEPFIDHGYMERKAGERKHPYPSDHL